MSFCRITGRSRGLPKPNYFPLLAPISPADAKRCCRITGKSYGLPSHHYIPVLLASRTSKTKCKITNVSGELGPHHFSPEIYYGNRKHELLPDYRYIFPVLDGSTEAQKALIEMLLGKQVTEDKRYVYTVQERRCSLVFTAQMEAAVRDGDVRDVMLAKDSDTVLIKMKQGRSVSMDFKDFTEDVEMFEGEGPNAEVLKQREIEEMEERKKKRKRSTGLSSMKKIFEKKEKLAEVEELEEEKHRLERISKKAKLDIRHEKYDLKTYSSNKFNVNHMKSKSSVTMCSGEWRDQMHPLIESWDWEAFEKEVSCENVVPKVTKLPSPIKISPYHCDAEFYDIDKNISQVSVSLESVPCVNPLKPIQSKPSEAVLNAIKDLSEERLLETAFVNEKLLNSDNIDMLPTLESVADVVKNIKKGKREKVAKVSGLTLDIKKAKKFIPGQHVKTPQGTVFVPGQTVETPDGPIFVPGLTVNTPSGPGLIPGHIVTDESTDEPFFLAGQVIKTRNCEEFVCGQTVQNKDESYKFVEGQTVISEDGLKFVPGKIVSTPTEDVFVPGQTMITPEGVQFIPGQTILESSGIIFTPGQNAKINNEWQFVPGQVVHHNEESEFVPGATLSTPNGLKFVPGQVVIGEDGDSCFIPGISKLNNCNVLEFVPGATVETIDGPKFVEGQIVQTEAGDKFMPGKSIVNTNGHVEFSIAKSINDITFSESTATGLPIDIKTCSISEESLYVFGHMVQTEKAIEFYPGPKVPKIEGKVVPGRLVKNDHNESRFVPGMMIEGIFVPGQIVFTENGEQFVPGQVIDTAEGPKFVPGQVVNTKSGPKFVPGQTIHTIDGPRFVPGQIIETKAGPTFIPGQVISTEDEGSRFVPGQVVDTEEGPRFVPGRVIETDDNCVTFVPGQIVQTPEGLKFVAPDLTEGEEGLEFSVQSFIVTPEELRLLKVKTNPNDTTSTKGELTIDTKMLKQLSAAGMSIGRQVPAELPAINVILNHTKNSEVLKAFVSDFGLKDDVANQLMEVISSIIEMSAHLKSSIHENAKTETSSSDTKNKKMKTKKLSDAQDMPGYMNCNGQSAHAEHVKNSIAAAVLAALVTAEQFEEANNNNGKHKYQLILKSIDTILGKSIDEDLVSAMFKVLQTEEIKENLCEEILDNSSQPKMELIKLALNSSNNKYSISDEEIIEKFGDFLASENEVLGPAFKNISKNDSNLLQHVLCHISDSISFIKSDHEAAETLQKAIVAAVQKASNEELEHILQSDNNKDIKQLLVQSIGLARVLGMADVAKNLVAVLNDEESLSKISNDAKSMNILKRLTVMRKLADKTPSLHSALRKLETDPELARTDPKLRDLVRESAVLMIVPEEPPLLTSEDVPLNLLHPENSLAMEDFLFQRKRHSGALLIMKKGLQAVVPREASRAVLTGEIAYTVLDENGIRHFEPLHVFSALNLSQPTAHRFSMYSCPIAEDNTEDLPSYTAYPNISNNQRVIRFGCGWSPRVSGVMLDRENTFSRVSMDNTPSYRGYTSRSMSRSRSTCSRSPSKVEDVLVAGADYKATCDDEVSLRAGDIVEVLDSKSSHGAKKPRLDPDLDVGGAQLLDASAAKHKIAVRPKKNHPKGKGTAKEGKPNGDRWLVRVLEDVEGGQMKTRQGYIPADVLQEKQSAERDKTALAARRQAVVRELIETEEEFGRDMQQVVTRYMKPMDKATTPKAVFDSRELLFSNFKQICEFHNTVLLEGIKYYASEPRMLGRALLRMEREFDKHVAYCRDEPSAQRLLASPPVAAYFQNLADKLGDDKGIAEHLKLPIQRINDYQLLLKELVKYSRRLGDDCDDLQKALELFLGVPSRATDNKFLASIEGYRGNIYKLGRLLTHDWFTVTDNEGKTKDRYLFLFKARILVCKVKRVADDRSVFLLKDIIKLPETEVRDIPDSLKFEVLEKSGVHLRLSAHKQSVKEHWLTEIQRNLADVVALAEHAADDLQVVSPSQVTPEPPEENKKKRERQEETKAEATQIQEKRTKVEATEKLEAKVESVAQSISESKSEKTQQVTTSKVETSVSSEQKVQEKRKVEEISEQSVTVQEKRSKKEEIVAQETQKTSTVQETRRSSKKSEDSENKISTREESIRDLIAKRKASLEIEAAQKLLKSEVTESSEVKTEVTSDLATKSAVTVKDSISTQAVTKAQETEIKSSTEQTSSEQTLNSQLKTEQKSSVSASAEEKSAKVESGEEVKEEVTDSGQTATEGDDMSRYSRTSRLSGEYSSSSRRLSGNRVDSSAEGTGLTSSFSRRESGSRLESSSRFESSSALESGTTARYESKYSASSGIDAGSKYGIESSFESKTESSKYSVDDGSSKIDSIASKYGIGLNSDSAVEGRSSKYAIESSYGSSNIGSSKLESSFEGKAESKYVVDSEATSKIDSIASKYGRKLSSNGTVESSKVESSYETVKNGGSSVESKYSKIANGSISTGGEAVQTLYKSASRDGRPVFSTTLEGQDIEPGEKATFECNLEASSASARLTWLKDNKPLTDRLMDRCSITSGADGSHKLQLQHCREDDSGLYTARAENAIGNAHCTAQLVVHKLTSEERQQRNALKMPYFEVALKDTEVMENTYLRFMVKVKGEPNPDVKFFRESTEITSSSERVSIIRRLADKGCYELVIADVRPGDAGVYRCAAGNIYGDCATEARVTVVDDKNIFGELLPGGEGLLAKGEKASFSWKRDGEPFDPEERFKVLLGDDEDSLALVFQHVRPEDAGLYTCVAKTSTGNISCSAELTVQGAVHELRREPEKPSLVIEHRSAIACAGASAMLELQCKGFPKPSVVFKHDGKVVEADTRHKFLYEDEESMSLVIKNVTTADAGTYHVTASNDLGEDTTTLDLVVTAAPKITKKIENQTCMMGATHTITIEIEGSPAPEVTFFKDGVEIKSCDRIQLIKESDTIYKIIMKDARLTDTGSYSIVAKNDINQCSDYWQWHVTSPPKVTKKLGESRVCEEKETVTFNIETQAEPAPTVTWFKNKTELTESSTVKISSSGESHTLVITSASRADAGEYSCEIRNVHGTSTDECSLKVRSAPLFTKRLQDLSAKEGDKKVELSVQVDAYPPPEVKWYHGDVEITEKKSVFTRVDSGDTHKLILKEVAAEMAGTFTCKVANDLGQDSCQATFTVHRKPRITKSLVDMTVEAGQTLKLEVEVEGCPEPKLIWYKDGKEVTTDARIKIDRDTQRLENYHLTVTLIKEEDGGEYEVHASNEMGSVSCKSTVTVHTREVSSRFQKESVTEHEIEDDSQTKHKLLEDDVDSGDKQTAKKGKTKSETAEEKSFWDDIEEEKNKKVSIEEVEKRPSIKAQKSVTEPEQAETKSIWDDDAVEGTKKTSQVEEVQKPRKATKSITEPEEAETKSFWDDDAEQGTKTSKVEEVEKPRKATKSLSEPEEADTKSVWDDNDDEKNKKVTIEEFEDKPALKAQKSVTEPETAETKSIWDDVDENANKKSEVEDVNKPRKATKSVSEPEQAETKSIWDDLDNEGKTQKSKLDDVSKQPSDKAKVTVTEPEEVEEKSIWDENHNEKVKKPIIEEIEEVEVKIAKKGKTKAEIIEEVPIAEDLKSSKRKSIRQESIPEEPLSAESEGRVFETVTTFKTGENGSIIMSKVSSSLSHGAIITGPAETRTLHKMTSTSVGYDGDEDDVFNIRNIIKPNVPHKTSLEVEEIASHSYYLSEMGVYTVPDHVRRGTYGIIEEPQTDSDAEQGSRRGRLGGNRTISILSLSDEDSWRNDSLSREISIEDLSKSIFDIDDSRKVFSKDSYKRHSSFIEDFFTDEGEEESVILREKSEKVFENDITEKLIHIKKEFNDNEYRTFEHKKDDVKNRIIEELVLGPEKVFDNITKNISETTFERRRKLGTKLDSLEEEHDEEIEELLRRSRRQRSLLDEIINHEDEQALPTITSSNMKDGHVYESLPIVYSVSAAGRPAPKVRWLHNGKEVRQNARISISKEGDLHKLEIEAVDMDDGGKWQCELSNDLGKKLQTAELSVTSVNEFRKPIFTQPLEAQRVMQREPVCLRAVCTADPLPHVTWLIDGKELAPDATAVVEESTKAIDHGLKECTYTLTIPTGRHSDTGTYTLQARNQYGFGESSARLDILLRPEIEGLKDVTAAPYEETTFVACVKANPIAEVQWSKDGMVIVPTSKQEVNSRPQDETYELVLKDLGLEDAGVYTLSAKNEIGETAQQAKLTIHTSAPVFTKPLQKQTIADYDSATLQVRCEGVPKPHVLWYRGDEEVSNDDRRTISAECEGQMESRLDIQHFNASDAGKYKVRAVNLAGEATCEAVISLAKVAPGFAVRLEKQKDVDEGEPLELKAKVQGSPMPKLAWYKDGVELPSNDPHIATSALPDGHVRLSIEHSTPADCGAYKLVLSNPHGDSSMQCAVAVNPTPRKPSFSQELEDTKAVVGQPLKLQVTVMAFPAPEVKWFKDGLPIRPSQATNFTNQPGGVIGLVIDKCRPEDAGVYSVTLANKLGEAASKATVEVQARERKPAFLSELSPTKVIEGFPARLEVKLIGHPAPALKWFHNGKEIAPSDRIRLVSQPDGAHALIIDEARPEDAGTYSVQASNEKGEAACEAVLTVASRTDDSSPQERPQFGHGLRDVTVDEGSRLALSAPFVGNPVPTPSWTKDDQPLKPNDRIVLSCDGTRLGLEINPAEPGDAGVYAVRIVNPLGEDKTQGTVTVKKVYQPPDFRQRFTDLQQLPTFDAKFPARVSGVPAPDVTWLKDGAAIAPGDKFHVKRDGDACCLYVRGVRRADAGAYTCVASNREGEARCQAKLEVVDNIDKRQRMEPPSFLKKIGDIEVLRGMSAKFTACVAGEPAPDIEWYRNDEKLFPCDRIRMDAESTGLLRLSIAGVHAGDVATYTCRATNAHGHAQCSAQLAYDSLEPQPNKRPLAEQYSDFDKMKKTGVCMPLADPPIISRMADRHLTLSWKPSIPHAARFPVTYQVEMCELPGGEWFTARAGLRTCVCDIRNLEPFRDYKFRIRVENKHGVSDPSPFAITHRCKLEPDPPRFVPYLAPGIDFRPDTSPYFPRDFDIERPPHDGYAQAPQFLRQEHECQYGVKGHNASLFWFVYGYPKPRITYYFEDQPIECGGRYDFSYTRNGQATLFINKMLERDEGYYEAVATNEHGTARQRVRLRVAEHPAFIQRPNESSVLQRRTARVTARVTGVPAPDIKWYKDWQPLAASTRIKMQFVEPDTYVLVLQDCLLKDEGLYSISARNVAGSVSSSAMLHVHEDEEVYCSKMREHPPRVKPSSKPLGDLYDLGDELGRGVQGVVYHAAERLTGRNYAVKIMHGNSDLKPFMKNELDIMNHLNSRGLVRLHAAFEQPHTLALVEELAGGGGLLRDRLLRGPGASEREIAGYVRQLLRAVKDMHDSGVAHLGLTMGELLLAHSGSDELKLCDFGLSRRIQFQQHGALDYGTPEYVAPEVANGEAVSFAADLWSVGVIAYILLSGISPFRGKNDRETLTKIREGKWEWHDEQYWSHFSQDCRDFISRLLVYSVHERLDVDAALRHPWMAYPDKAYNDEFLVSTDRLRNYYNLFKEWNRNAACHTWFRRRPLSGAFEHPSKMVYPPGLTYTPEATPERETDSRERHPAAWDLKFKQWDHPDWEVSATSESHYQNGPDTYLLQLRDTGFPVRLREYMKVACRRHAGYALAARDAYDPRTPIIRERRRFTDVMDEEIDDEQRERIYNYGSDTAPAITRRLRHELGTRLDSYAEAEALMEAKRDGQPPFFREKPLPLAAREGEPACLSCLAVGDPKPSIQWFKNDMVIAEGQRIKILEDGQGRSTLQLQPAMRHDVGYYKVVARNKVGQTVARVRVVEATTPDAPDSPTTADTSDTEVLLRWKQPRHDGHAPVLCYSLQVKKGDALEWVDVAANIDHEFYVVKNLTPDTSYQFRLAARNKMGWSEKGIPTHLVKTKAAGASKIQVTKAMAHLQQLTEAGREVVEEERPVLDYTTEENPIEWDTTTDLAERYSFISEIHRGRFCTVVKGVDKRTDAVVVAKVLEVRAETEVQVQREFEMLRRLRHSSIAGLLAAHQVPGAGCAVLVMERLQGADVLTYLSSLHSYSEQLVASIVLQVLDGLQYLHWRGAAHLDLQPDNVVLAPGRAGVFKLVDLGSAHRVTRLGGSVPQVGDLEFKAPEIVNDEPAYPQTDVWSLGVLTYIMLSGVSPFRGAAPSDTRLNISYVRYRFEHLYKELTQEATRFLMFIFKKVPLKRPTAEEAAEHRWLAQTDFITRKRERAVFLGHRIKEFSDEYHERKSQEASQADLSSKAFGAAAALRQLARSNSIQEELQTTFASQA